MKGDEKCLCEELYRENNPAVWDEIKDTGGRTFWGCMCADGLHHLHPRDHAVRIYYKNNRERKYSLFDSVLRLLRESSACFGVGGHARGGMV